MATTNFDRYTVKPAFYNTQNDDHQWLSRSLRLHQIRYWAGILQRSPNPLDGLRGPA